MLCSSESLHPGVIERACGTGESVRRIFPSWPPSFTAEMPPTPTVARRWVRVDIDKPEEDPLRVPICVEYNDLSSR